jgi:hypothetical protein
MKLNLGAPALANVKQNAAGQVWLSLRCHTSVALWRALHNSLHSAVLRGTAELCGAL